MRDYAKFSPQYWSGDTSADLRAAGRETMLIALYLISNPFSNYIEFYRLSLSNIVEDTTLSLDEVRAALENLDRIGFARYDEATKMMWVLNGAKWQIGQLAKADKRVKFVNSEFSSVPNSCSIKQDFYRKYAGALHLAAPAGMSVDRDI
jgi:hypothetical protein